MKGSADSCQCVLAFLTKRNMDMIKRLLGMPGPRRSAGPRERVFRQAPEDHAGSSPWWDRAACRGAATDLFFPVGAAAGEARWARQICARCPVQEQCLAYALASGQQYGIWGGRDEQERRQLRQQPREPSEGSVPAGHASENAGAQAGSGPC
jgi:WhiB family transcriptional regulator, redox-sensing transcriptional regulator